MGVFKLLLNIMIIEYQLLTNIFTPKWIFFFPKCTHFLKGLCNVALDKVTPFFPYRIPENSTEDIELAKENKSFCSQPLLLRLAVVDSVCSLKTSSRKDSC